MTIELNGIPFELLHHKALYKPDEALLIIADIHLGKARHFRKSGIPFPVRAQDHDYFRLEELITAYQPHKVYFLGDLFHSSFNHDWHYFCQLIGRFGSTRFVLVRGNHDIIDLGLFKQACIDVVNSIEDDRFIYTHIPLDTTTGGRINIAGHIHPGIVLSGTGRQSVKLPCFYKYEDTFLLPAFGILTGLYPVGQTRGNDIYAVLPDGVRHIW